SARPIGMATISSDRKGLSLRAVRKICSAIATAMIRNMVMRCALPGGWVDPGWCRLCEVVGVLGVWGRGQIPHFVRDDNGGVRDDNVEGVRDDNVGGVRDDDFEVVGEPLKSFVIPANAGIHWLEVVGFTVTGFPRSRE